MGRWEGNAVGRLQEAAMELYRDPGYDKVTVAEIAARAGLTRRTLFRYFSEKREVLFFGAEKLEAFVSKSVRDATPGMRALDAVATALAAATRRTDEDPAFADFARQRHALIRTYAELRERELAKLAALASAAADALRHRGVAGLAASVAAQAAVVVFKVGFESWVDDPKRRKMEHHFGKAMRGLGAVVLDSVVLEQDAPRGSAPLGGPSRKVTSAKPPRR